MGNKRTERFTRNSQRRRTNELIIVATEGAITEKSYIGVLLHLFQKEQEKRAGERINVCLKHVGLRNQSSPSGRLKVLKREISNTLIDDNYTAWYICDRDEWRQDQFQTVRDWVASKPSHNRWILNSPNFEYWLALHFSSQSESRAFFKRYEKRVATTDFSYAQVVGACKKARSGLKSASSLWEQDGSEMCQFVEFLAEKFKLTDDFRR